MKTDTQGEAFAKKAWHDRLKPGEKCDTCPFIQEDEVPVRVAAKGPPSAPEAGVDR